MKNIQMVDLLSQFRKIEPEVMEAIRTVMENTSFIKGPEVSEFASSLASYLSTRHVIPCGNGTDALQVALMALDLKPGDEVITSPFTFIATIEVIRLLGLKPVLADIREDNFNIDIDRIRESISDRTRCLLPVHLFGQCADMESILKTARKHDLYIVEDAAQALGAEYTFSDGRTGKAGTIGDIGCTSFFPSKNLGAFGDGGALFTNNPVLAEKIVAMVNHGMKVRYYYDYVGVNSRLDTLQAAILNVKLKHLDEYHRSRQRAAEFYDLALPDLEGIILPARDSHSTHIFHQYTLRVTHGKRDSLKEFLQTRGIPAMIYYPLGLHLQNAYRDLGYKEGDFPVTEKVSAEVLSLPMHTELEEDQLHYISASIRDFFKK
ncbi:MAG: DegT/DnrJ/EryC1/StrS family aminotransferase [Bacteroidales bacterium]|nr:DegT/DnrJ/EryC1/StrS family aminotransferase [Bacteroidales bacterium]